MAENTYNLSLSYSIIFFICFNSFYYCNIFRSLIMPYRKIIYEGFTKTAIDKRIKAIRNKEFLIDNVETYIKWKFNLKEEEIEK